MINPNQKRKREVKVVQQEPQEPQVPQDNKNASSNDYLLIRIISDFS
jgi:hypothetical protein